MFENLTILDAILPILIIIGFLLGYKKGFFATITKPLRVIASICLTVLIAAPIINVWTRPYFAGKVEGWIYNSLIENCPDITAETAADSMPTLLKLLANIMNIDLSGADATAATEEIISGIAQKMSLPIGNLIAVIVTYITLFIVMMILLKLLIALLNKFMKKGIIGRINKILGLLTGGVIAMISACIIANIAYAISPDFADGFVCSFFKNINPFAFLMKF